MRHKTYEIIFGHETWAGRTFDVLLIVAILASVAVIMLESVASIRAEHGSLLRKAEWFFTALFTVEYVTRLWCVGRPGVYARSFLGIIDLLAVLPTYISLLFPGGQVITVVRILRVIRVFRIVKLARYVGEARVLGQTLRASRYKITIFVITVVSITVIVGSLMYLLEGPPSGFTGAVRDREGLFQSADGGTLLLDEIGDMAPAMQHRLLRVLQEREVTPVGGAHPIPVDVRILASTNRDLKSAVGEGLFREDLFYRLNVFCIDLPPLKERRSDLPLLVEHFLRGRGTSEAGAFAASCSPLAMRKLQGYHWPGNVRELFAALESAWIQAGGGRVEAHHLPQEVRTSGGIGPSPPERYRHGGTMADERAAIEIALEEAGGLRSRAADILGMGRTTLWRKMRAYGFVVEGDDTLNGSE